MYAVGFIAGPKGGGLEVELFGHKSRAFSLGLVMWAQLPSKPGLSGACMVFSLSIC